MEGDLTAGAPAGCGPTVLVVGGKLKIVQKAQELGLEVVYFQRPEMYTEAHRRCIRASFLFDYTDIPQAVELARVVHRYSPIGHSVSLTESGLPVAGHINDALGLPGTGADVALRFKDKWRMRQHLAARGFPPVGCRLLCDERDLLEMGDRYGWPLIVKPTDSSASAGVFRVEGPDQVADAFRRTAALRADRLPEGVVLDRFLVEEYVSGPEVSVEAVSAGGNHTILAITEKLLAEDTFVEIGHALPARLGGVAERRLAAATVAFLDAMGLRDGPSHTEFRLDDGMPRLIESHDRVGGDRIHDLVQAACGVDQDRYALGWPFGLAPDPRSGWSTSSGAATRFFDARPGEVVAIEGLAEIARHPAVIALEATVKLGDTVRPLRSSWDRVGQVAVRAATTADAIALAEDLAARVHVATR